LRIVYTDSSAGDPDKRLSSVVEGLTARGHDVRLFRPPQAPIAKLRPAGVKVLYEWLKTHGCDVVHAHGSTDAWLAAFALLALGRRYPMVYSPRTPISKNPGTRWLLTRAASRIVVPTDARKEELVERHGTPEQRIDVIDGEIDRLERLYFQVRR
jgi:hypothetical protein